MATARLNKDGSVVKTYKRMQWASPPWRGRAAYEALVAFEFKVASRWFLLFAAVCLSAVAPAFGQWPVYRGDSQLRGALPTTLPVPLTLRWSFRTTGQSLGPPVLEGDRAYVGSSDHHLYCIALEDGRVIWKTDLGAAVDGAALVAGDRVLAGTGEGVVHALGKAGGEKIWSFKTEDRIVGGPNSVTVKDQRRIVFGSHDMHVYCLDARDGSRLWTYKTDNFVNATPAVTSSGIVFGGCDGLLHVVDPEDGSPLATVDVGSYVAASVAVDDGVAFLGHYGGEVLAIDLASKRVLWRYAEGSRGDPFFAPPAVSGTHVVAGNRDGAVSCLERESGALLWRFRTRNAVEAGAVIAGDRCFVGSTDGRIYALDLASGRELWSYEIGAAISVSPALSGTTLAVSAEDGVLYLFGSAAPGDPSGR